MAVRFGKLCHQVLDLLLQRSCVRRKVGYNVSRHTKQLIIHSDLGVGVLCPCLVFSVEGQGFHALADFVKGKEASPIGEIHCGRRSAIGAYSRVSIFQV